MNLLPWTLKWVEVPITVSTAAYTAGDVVGGLLSCAVDQYRGGGFVDAARLVDDHAQAEPFTLYLFDSAPAVIADGDPFVGTVANGVKYIGQIAIAATDYITWGSEKLALKQLDNPLAFGSLASGQLYAYLVPPETPDYNAADDLTLHLRVWSF